ncbi:MAG TPA: HAD family phosphatase [Myxococcota bacterium]|jgi:epoxide hydrolase-like predicted phosphatase|nr:HAD family phosphatase [Myxococcota bacterium]
MPRRYDAVLFDFGGVFTPSPFGAFESVARELGVEPRVVLEIVFGPYELDTDHPWHRLERGELGLGDARAEIMELAKARGLSLDPIQVLVRMSGGGATREPLIARTRALRAEGYRTALVTNNAREFGPSWRNLLPLSELFDAVVDSSAVGVRKPNPAIFERALAEIGGVAARRSIFLDDHPGNVAAAERLGMQGVLVGDDPSAALARLESLLSGDGGLRGPTG